MSPNDPSTAASAPTMSSKVETTRYKNPPFTLSMAQGAMFKNWLFQWSVFAELVDLKSQSPSFQVAQLAACMDTEIIPIFRNLGLSEDDSKDVNKVLAALENFAMGSVNESVERLNFNRRVQQMGESIDEFIVGLRDLAVTCNFCNDECMNKQIRDRLIVGVRSHDIKADLLKKKDLDLPLAMTIARAAVLKY